MYRDGKCWIRVWHNSESSKFIAPWTITERFCPPNPLLDHIFGNRCRSLILSPVFPEKRKLQWFLESPFVL